MNGGKAINTFGQASRASLSKNNVQKGRNAIEDNRMKKQYSNESSSSNKTSGRLKPQDKVPPKPVWENKKPSIQTIEEMNS